VDDVDFTAAATLRKLHGILREKNITMVFTGVSPLVYAQLERSGIPELVGRDGFYPSGVKMVKAYRQKLGPSG
jgi:MFS superfamily sulfate permease-like transporter